MTENEDSILSRQVAPEPKTNRRKMKIAFVAIIFLSLLSLVGSGVYRYYRAATSLERYNQEMEAALSAERAKKMADTFGGKTPAETLSLYIDALKKGDYELASKYFVERNRNEELLDLRNTTQGNMTTVIELIEQTAKNTGGYSEDKIFYTIDRPLTIDFELYPNGIWKIIEI